MRLPLKARTISTAVVIPSAIIVAALAVLEYRWSTRVSEATAVRLADSLQMSMMNWQKDFFRYFSEIGLSLRIDPVEDAPGRVSQYVRRFAEWKAVAKYPRLVANVYLLKGDGTALRLNFPAGSFEPEAWPPRFAPLRGELRNTSAAFLRTRALQQARQESAGGNAAYGVFGNDDPAAGWRFEPRILALFHPVISGSAAAPSVDWIAIELNETEIRTRVLADLSRTYFQGTDGLDYLVAVVAESRAAENTSGKPSSQVMYSSDPGFGSPEPTDADGTISLFAKARDSSGGSPVHVFHVPPDNKGPDASVRISWFPFLGEKAPGTDWRLVVRHRRGGALGAFVVEMRRRDLAIGFGVLLVLAVNMAMLIVTSHRAQRLAQLQMDFVTAVSHELRTPLTVIISGADNICNGVVATSKQMAQYGAVIGNQARQLYGLVERILLFAASRQDRLRYNLRPLDVHRIIDAALAGSAGMIEAAHADVECDIPEELPMVAGDAEALSQCLQNLIANAVKYSNGQKWIGIRASAQEHGLSGKELQISVSDRGIGITPDDLPHIFEPFYRSRAVLSAQIHGTGLGLPLSQSIAEAMEGRLTVSSTPGHGSTFTLSLPCLENPA
ncbi:MAG TPA: HAMP domain-containing sensor histidine kinase [Bryobacteraceae bacterium]|jgi:signal transduction histidine kinase